MVNGEGDAFLEVNWGRKDELGNASYRLGENYSQLNLTDNPPIPNLASQCWRDRSFDDRAYPVVPETVNCQTGTAAEQRGAIAGKIEHTNYFFDSMSPAAQPSDPDAQPSHKLLDRSEFDPPWKTFIELYFREFLAFGTGVS